MTKKPVIRLISHGLKKGTLPKADLYLDCRCIINPYHQPAFQAVDGGSSDLQAWVADKATPQLEAFQTVIHQCVDTLAIRRREEKNPFSRPMVVCCFCAYGMHRSVAVKHILARRLGSQGFTVLMNDLQLPLWEGGKELANVVQLSQA